MTTENITKKCNKDPDCPYWSVDTGCTASITEVELGCEKKSFSTKSFTKPNKEDENIMKGFAVGPVERRYRKNMNRRFLFELKQLKAGLRCVPTDIAPNDDKGIYLDKAFLDINNLIEKYEAK